jgi:hypothetical protein
METGAIEGQLLKDKMWREHQQDAIDFQQNAGLGDAFDRGGKKATGPVI